MRGAIDYPFLLVLVVLIASGMLIVQVGNKFQFERQLGDTQTAVLRVNGDVTLFDAYVEDAARQVFAATFKDAKSHPELFFLSVDPETVNCAMLNDAKDPKVVFTPNIESRLSEKLTQGLKPYLDSYAAQTPVVIGKGDFAVGISQGVFTVVGLAPVQFSMFDAGGVRIGQASHRPAFTVQFDHKLDGYVQAVDALKGVAAKCSYAPDVAKCLADNPPQDLSQTVLQDDKVMFQSKSRTDLPCFELFLPPQSKQAGFEAPQPN